MPLPFSEKALIDVLQQTLGAATSIRSFVSVQSLWSGYGEIIKLNLYGANRSSVIIKWINPPTEQNHPRGWNTDVSHQRKLYSYRVEMRFYQQWAAACNNHCRIPDCLFAGRWDLARL